MSELKGQLLGIILVISIFAAVSGILISAYKKAANNITSQIEETTSLVAESTSL